MSIQPTSSNDVSKQTNYNIKTTKPMYQATQLSGLTNDSVELSNKKIENKKNAISFSGLSGIFRSAVGKISSNKIVHKPIEVSPKETSEVVDVVVKASEKQVENVRKDFDNIIQGVQKEVSKVEQKAQKEASEIYQDMEKKLQEVTDLCNKIQQGDYQGTAKFNGISLEEFDESGNLIRKSRSYVDCSTESEHLIHTIIEHNGKVSNKADFLDGKPKLYQKGYKISDEGFGRDLGVLYKDGKLKTYIKDSSEAEDVYTRNLEMNFEDGKLTEYKQGFSELDDGSWKQDVQVDFEDGKPTRYIKGYEESDCGSSKYELGLKFIDGKWQEIKD